jgi:iron-sulfur cluster assembly protein
MTETMTDTNLIGIDTEIVGAEDKDKIYMTENAFNQIHEVRESNNVPEEYFLRMGAQSGGCSGFQYIIGFDSEVKEMDKEITIDNVNVVIDRKSLFYLQGVTLDYVDDVNGKGFVFNNPNNEHACGCGGH